MKIAETDRLLLRHLAPDDAEFYCRQLNEPSWIANIGDRQVRSAMDAEAQIRTRALVSYAEHGFGMYLVELKADGTPIGLCGLVRRETLPGPDIGFALLEAHWGRGYAEEAARAVLNHAFGSLRLSRLLAITTPANERSGRLLEKIGFTFEGMVTLGGDTLRQYALAAPSNTRADESAI